MKLRQEVSKEVALSNILLEDDLIRYYEEEKGINASFKKVDKIETEDESIPLDKRHATMKRGNDYTKSTIIIEELDEDIFKSFPRLMGYDRDINSKDSDKYHENLAYYGLYLTLANITKDFVERGNTIYSKDSYSKVGIIEYYQGSSLLFLDFDTEDNQLTKKNILSNKSLMINIFSELLKRNITNYEITEEYGRLQLYLRKRNGVITNGVIPLSFLELINRSNDKRNYNSGKNILVGKDSREQKDYLTVDINGETSCIVVEDTKDKLTRTVNSLATSINILSDDIEITSLWGNNKVLNSLSDKIIGVDSEGDNLLTYLKEVEEERQQRQEFLRKTHYEDYKQYYKNTEDKGTLVFPLKLIIFNDILDVLGRNSKNKEDILMYINSLSATGRSAGVYFILPLDVETVLERSPMNFGDFKPTIANSSLKIVNTSKGNINKIILGESYTSYIKGDDLGSCSLVRSMSIMGDLRKVYLTGTDSNSQKVIKINERVKKVRNNK